MVSPPCEQRTLEQRAGHLTGAPAGTRAARESRPAAPHGAGIPGSQGDAAVRSDGVSIVALFNSWSSGANASNQFTFDGTTYPDHLPMWHDITNSSDATAWPAIDLSPKYFPAEGKEVARSAAPRSIWSAPSFASSLQTSAGANGWRDASGDDWTVCEEPHRHGSHDHGAAPTAGALAALGCRRVATIALFHSVLGVRPGLLESAEMLRDHGHTVHVIDQYEGRMFEDYGAALEYVEGVGFPALMAFALGATAELPDRLVTMGFSNGAGMAEYVAGNRQVSGVVMLGGALDPNELGVRWPHGVDGQVHTTVDDPWREQQGIDAVVAAAEGAGGHVEVFDYPGSGHLFADPSKADEFQPAEAELMWSRVLDFLRRMDGVDSPVRTG
jgi:dienelactone hydrolase